MEEWKYITETNNRYMVSNLGNVKFVEKNRLVTPNDNGNGYKSIQMSVTPGNKRRFLLHRLVAKYFLPNPHNYSDVNHIDEDKGNNVADNLEWCSHSNNLLHSWKRGSMEYCRSVASHPVAMIDNDGQIVRTFPSIVNAERTLKISFGQVSKAVRYNRPCRGYLWKYV